MSRGRARAPDAWIQSNAPRSAVLVLCLGGWAAQALAQQPGPLPADGLRSGVSRAQASGQAPETPASERTPFTAGWRDGFVIQDADGDFRLQIGLLVQADGRFAARDRHEAVDDTFLIRRVRPSLRGRVAGRFEFYFAPDFAGGGVAVQDAYVDTMFAPAFRLRVGKAKTPFGLERLQSASNTLFFERALPSSLAPNRDVGVQALGDLAGGVVSYAGGILNGVADGASGDRDTGDSKDLVGRVTVRPFSRRANGLLQGLGLALSGSRGRQSGPEALPAFRTPSLQQPYFSYGAAAADGIRTRYSPQVFYYRRTFGGFAEYVHTSVPVVRGAVRQGIAHRAWQVAGSVVLTGEAATDSAGLRPRASFDPRAGHWGAFQVAARYHALRIDDSVVALNLGVPGGSGSVDGWTLGVNWYMTPHVKQVFNFERMAFERHAGAGRPPENAVVFRTQLNF